MSHSTPTVPPQSRNDPSERLSTIFEPCLEFILELKSADSPPDVDVLRHRARHRLDRACRTASRQGADVDDIREACFAVVAFLDETVLEFGPPHREAWMAHSFQFELFDRYDAGEEFFVRLNGLRRDSTGATEVLEVYYLCLALGFQGQYRLQRPETTTALVRRVYRDLEQRDRPGDVHLSPHGVPEDVGDVRDFMLPVPSRVAAIALIIMGVVYLVLSLWASYDARTVRDDIQDLRAAPHVVRVR